MTINLRKIGNTDIEISELGMSSDSQVDENVDDFQKKLPSDFWIYLKDNDLIDKRAPIV